MSLTPPARRRGLTLIELLVAIVVLSVLAGATTVSISRSVTAVRWSAAEDQAWTRAEAAASRIAADLTNVVREGDLYEARVFIESGRIGGVAADEIIVFTHAPTRARPGVVFAGLYQAQPEGDAYEVQYRFIPTEEPALGIDGRPVGGASGAVWRRIDPVPDDVWDGGGVAQPIAEGITSLSFEAYDGRRWYENWDSDRDGYPHAVRVVVTAIADDVTRGRATQAVVRRVIAMDRVPLPYVFLSPSERQAQEEQEAGR